MSETRTKRKIEFIESYWTGGEYGADYVWNDNHGELIRCMDCRHWIPYNDKFSQSRCERNGGGWFADEFCSNAERRDDNG